MDVIWVAAALTAGAGGAVIATASSAPHRHAQPSASALQVSAASDPALTSANPSDSDAMAKLAAATGIPPAPDAVPQTWQVGGRTVLGYSTAEGSFCFEFSEGAGGCLQPEVLTDEMPLDITTDYGPGTFNAYGLARDGVVAVAIRTGRTSRAAAFAHNAFTFSDGSLGGAAAMAGEAVATMSDGTTRVVPFRVGSLDNATVGLP